MTTILPNVPVSPLSQKLIDDMNMRDFLVATQRNHIRDLGASPASCGDRRIPRPPKMFASSRWPRVRPACRCPP